MSVLIPKKLWRRPLLANQEGFSLVEVLLAIAVALIAITALVVASQASLHSAGSSRDQAIADQLLRTSLEALRIKRDSEGFAVYAQNGIYNINVTTIQRITSVTTLNCANINTTDFDIGTYPGYRRGFRVEHPNANTAKLTMLVCYNYKGTTAQKVEVQTYLSNWTE